MDGARDEDVGRYGAKGAHRQSVPSPIPLDDGFAVEQIRKVDRDVGSAGFLHLYFDSGVLRDGAVPVVSEALSPGSANGLSP